MEAGDLFDLSARASAAAGPDEWLDAAICAVVRLPHPNMPMGIDDWNWTARGPRVAAQKRGVGMTIHWDPHPLTSNEWLARHLLAGACESWIKVEEECAGGDNSEFVATIRQPARDEDVERPARFGAATRALAVCAAALHLRATLGWEAASGSGVALYV